MCLQLINADIAILFFEFFVVVNDIHRDLPSPFLLSFSWLGNKSVYKLPFLNESTSLILFPAKFWLCGVVLLLAQARLPTQYQNRFFIVSVLNFDRDESEHKDVCGTTEVALYLCVAEITIGMERYLLVLGFDKMKD